MFTIQRSISEDLAINRLKLYTNGQSKASFFVECLKRSRLIDLKNTELEQTRRRRQRERHLKMLPRVSTIISNYSKLLCLQNVF